MASIEMPEKAEKKRVLEDIFRKTAKLYPSFKLAIERSLATLQRTLPISGLFETCRGRYSQRMRIHADCNFERKPTDSQALSQFERKEKTKKKILICPEQT